MLTGIYVHIPMFNIRFVHLYTNFGKLVEDTRIVNPLCLLARMCCES